MHQYRTACSNFFSSSSALTPMGNRTACPPPPFPYSQMQLQKLIKHSPDTPHVPGRPFRVAKEGCLPCRPRVECFSNPSFSIPQQPNREGEAIRRKDLAESAGSRAGTVAPILQTISVSILRPYLPSHTLFFILLLPSSCFVSSFFFFLSSLAFWFIPPA